MCVSINLVLMMVFVIEVLLLVLVVIGMLIVVHGLGGDHGDGHDDVWWL